MERIWLEKAIVAYISNNPNVDSVDIVSHFKLRADITLESIKSLEDKGIIKNEHRLGLNYKYSIINNKKNEVLN